MHGLLGDFLPFGMPEDQSQTERILHGYAFLVEIAGVDLGYDPQAWHEQLQATDAGGYRWSNKHLGFPRRIATALANSEWQATIATAQATATLLMATSTLFTKLSQSGASRVQG